MRHEYIYSRSSNGIRISVSPKYLESESKPLDNIYVWSYTIVIENNKEVPLQLLNRHWKIYGDDGTFQEISGAGVIGKQPIIEPKGKFEYTSSASLKTTSGMMLGDYEMINRQNNESIDVQVPPFSLDSPYSSSTPH